MSSTYLTWPPKRWLKAFRTFLSMYSGQLENVQLPIGTFGGLMGGIAVASFVPGLGVPGSPMPLSFDQATGRGHARPLNRRRLSATLHHERVLGLPGQVDLAAGGERLGLGVLREDV